LLFQKLNPNLVFSNNFNLKELATYRVIPIYVDTFSIKFLTCLNDTIDNKNKLFDRFQKNIELETLSKIDFKKLFDIFRISNNIFVEFLLNDDINIIFDTIFKNAIQSNCSDIHIENFKSIFLLRFRIDGILNERFIINLKIFNSILSKIKLLSNLDLVNKFKPLDSRFSKVINNKSYDFRVSIIPSSNHQSVVIRILDKSNMIINLDKLGINEYSLKLIKNTILQTTGLILFTGPTGSGKTTTLYSILNKINNMEKKIITIEDPVEYDFENIMQTQINHKHEFTFNNALKSILRHDPDILMIGEMRDNESIKLAIQTAMTGHLILSTLHSNGAIDTIIRLQELGIDNFIIIHTLLLVQFQRLIRILCPDCKEETNIDISLNIENNNKKVFKPIGCHKCFNSGYLGRKMVCETIFIDEEIKKLIIQNASSNDYLKYIKTKGFKTIFEDALDSYLIGITSIEEVLKIRKLSYEIILQ
jgi:general secretion pathway protein E